MTEYFPGTTTERVLTLFSRGESFDPAGFAALFTETPVYAFGNFDVCFDKPAIEKSAAAFFAQINAVYHDIKMMWESGDCVFVEMDVSYWRKADNSLITLPCCDIFRLEDGKFSELRIFMDVNPVFDPKGAVPASVSVFTGASAKHLAQPGTMKEFYANHAEGKRRVQAGFAPKWSVDGPKWAIESGTAV